MWLARAAIVEEKKARRIFRMSSQANTHTLNRNLTENEKAPFKGDLNKFRLCRSMLSHLYLQSGGGDESIRSHRFEND